MARSARKTKTKTQTATPAAEATEQTFTLAEALEAAGQTMEDLKPAEEAPKAPRPAGESNLARTIARHRAGYQVALHPKGNKTQNNGDLVARLLLPIPLPTLKAFSAARFDGRSYDHLNDGHARMCIGNLIRGAIKTDSSVLEWLEAQQPKEEVAA